MLPDLQALIDYYKLTPLPIEGTLFARSYTSNLEMAAEQPIATAMIGLYCQQPFSASCFHKLTVDEIWHFYHGDPLRLVLLYPDGSSQDVIMGIDFLQGQTSQFVVPAGVWQAGHLLEGGRYALFGCTLAPGFTNDNFVGGSAAQLLASHPDRALDIARFACASDQLHLPEGFDGS